MRFSGVVAVGLAALVAVASARSSTAVSTAASVSQSRLIVNTRPVFPIMVFRECPWSVPGLLAAGVNTFMGAGCDGNEAALVSAIGGRAYVVTDIDNRVDGSGVIGWHLLDEADMQTIPAALPTVRSATRVTFLTMSHHFWSYAARGPLPLDQYPAMVARAGMVGFDLYPLQAWCRKAFTAVFDAQRALVRLAKGKPTFQWIEANIMGDLPCGAVPAMTPKANTLRAEVWLAIAGGAKGIGYFPGHFELDVAPEVKRTNAQIAALGPVLLAPETKVTFDPKGLLRAGGRVYGKQRWVIAVNTATAALKGAFSLPKVKAKSAEVWGEGRKVPVRRGRIVDTFAPLAVHIYVVR